MPRSKKTARRKTAPSRALRSVYIFTDLEGCAGVDDWDPRHHEYVNTARYVYERSEMQRLLTGEVNAAIEGCLDAGVESVIVNDAHGAGRTILIEELHPRARLFRGKQRPAWCVGLEGCDALFHVGMHAISGTPSGTLCHTMSRTVKDYRVNGRRVSEFALSMLWAGHFGIPAPFFSGEQHACQQARRIVKGLVTVETKEGFSVESAIHLAPLEARARIREGAARAIEAARQGKVQPLCWPGPYKLEKEMRSESYTPAQAGPGMKYINPRTMAWFAGDIESLLMFALHGQPPKNETPRKAKRKRR